jgi:hypothetical protein
VGGLQGGLTRYCVKKLKGEPNVVLGGASGRWKKVLGEVGFSGESGTKKQK